MLPVRKTESATPVLTSCRPGSSSSAPPKPAESDQTLLSGLSLQDMSVGMCAAQLRSLDDEPRGKCVCLASDGHAPLAHWARRTQVAPHRCLG
jgi:hypothetical protein